jgi:AcrR family transcriptional regulator
MTEVQTGVSGAAGVDGPLTEADSMETRSRPMRADAVRNHEKILAAAEEIFALDGVAVPIDIVAERAGVGVGTLYRHFPTKESLYEAIVTTRIEGLLAVADGYMSDSDPGAALNDFLREFARQASEKQDLFEALEQNGVDVKTRFSELVDELMEKLDTLRQRAASAGAIRTDVETSDIMNLVSGTCHAAGHSGVDEAGFQRLVNIVIAGLQPTN